MHLLFVYRNVFLYAKFIRLSAREVDVQRGITGRLNLFRQIRVAIPSIPTRK